MRDKIVRSIKHIILILISLLILSCNIFSPEYDHFENTAQPGNNNSIRGLMDNFIYSYTFKDSFLYEELLDEDFTFEYDNDGTSESWTRDEDIRITKKLFRNFKKIDLIFNDIFPLHTNSPDTTVYTSFRIGFHSGEKIITLTGYAEFLLKKYIIDTDSVNYKILKWKDLK